VRVLGVVGVVVINLAVAVHEVDRGRRVLHPKTVDLRALAHRHRVRRAIQVVVILIEERLQYPTTGVVVTSYI
jgi:hypothetical protein